MDGLFSKYHEELVAPMLNDEERKAIEKTITKLIKNIFREKDFFFI